MFDEKTAHHCGGDPPCFAQGAVVIHSGSQDGKFHGVKHGVIFFHILKPVPLFPGFKNPGRLIFRKKLCGTVGKRHSSALVFHRRRLPHGKEPFAVAAEVPFKIGHFPPQLNCFKNNVAQNRFAVVLHHFCCHIQRGDHAVLGRGGTVHHVGFVEKHRSNGPFGSVADVEHGGL